MEFTDLLIFVIIVGVVYVLFRILDKKMGPWSQLRCPIHATNTEADMGWYKFTISNEQIVQLETQKIQEKFDQILIFLVGDSSSFSWKVAVFENRRRPWIYAFPLNTRNELHIFMTAPHLFKCQNLTDVPPSLFLSLDWSLSTYRLKCTSLDTTDCLTGLWGAEKFRQPATSASKEDQWMFWSCTILKAAIPANWQRLSQRG